MTKTGSRVQRFLGRRLAEKHNSTVANIAPPLETRQNTAEGSGSHLTNIDEVLQLSPTTEIMSVKGLM